MTKRKPIPRMLRLGALLVEARGDYTLRDVEHEVDISSGYLCQMETGFIAEPSPHKLYALAQFYGIEYAQLMEAAGYPVEENRSCKCPCHRRA